MADDERPTDPDERIRALERIKRDIAEIAKRPRSVEFDEIARIVDRLGRVGFATMSKPGTHSHLFRVGDQIFTVCRHNPRRKELKVAYVNNFLNAMIALELLDEE
jgi:hypothetical protein